jgi:uncharacterized protein (DUF433 family)
MPSDLVCDFTLVPITPPRRLIEVDGNDKNPAVRDWASSLSAQYPKPVVSREDWFVERVTQAVFILQEHVECSPDVMGGMPVLKGTRFTLSRLFAELADGLSVVAIASDFSLDEESLRRLMEGFGCYLGRPVK